MFVKFFFPALFSWIFREEEFQLQKRKKRKIKGNSRLSFADDFENGSEEEDGEYSNNPFSPFFIFIFLHSKYRIFYFCRKEKGKLYWLVVLQFVWKRVKRNGYSC